jgi:hypothetical protein
MREVAGGRRVSWLFFKAVQAGLAVKRPYLDSYRSIRRGEGKTANWPRRGGLRRKWAGGVM